MIKYSNSTWCHIRMRYTWYFCALELGANTAFYKYFTTPNVDYMARFMCLHGASTFAWSIGTITRMTLTSAAMPAPSFSSSSGKILKFNDKPFSNALDAVNRLEPVDYEQTQYLVDQYTADAPQSYQCGFFSSIS